MITPKEANRMAKIAMAERMKRIAKQMPKLLAKAEKAIKKAMRKGESYARFGAHLGYYERIALAEELKRLGFRTEAGACDGIYVWFDDEVVR